MNITGDIVRAPVGGGAESMFVPDLGTDFIHANGSDSLYVQHDHPMLFSGSLLRANVDTGTVSEVANLLPDGREQATITASRLFMAACTRNSTCSDSNLYAVDL